MTADAEQMMLGGMATMKKPSYMNWNVNYMNRIKRRAYYGFRTSSSSIPFGNFSGMVCRFYFIMDSTCKRKVMIHKIRMRLSMMLHIGWVTYLVRILIALSVLLNVILGGRLNQTFSARNWEWKRNEKINLVRPLDALLGDGHCSRAWSYWKVRRKW